MAIFTVLYIYKKFYRLFSGNFLCTLVLSMRPYFAKASIGTGFEPLLNWFQSTALTARLHICLIRNTTETHLKHDKRNNKKKQGNYEAPRGDK